MYFPLKNKPNPNYFSAEDMSVVQIHTDDHLTLTAWYKPASSHYPTILFLHGNAGHIGYRMPLVREFIHAGFGVFLLEYRGYGGNPGSPSEQGLYKDAFAALAYLKQHSISNQNIVLYGESLGTGIATKLASTTPFCSVILQSPYTSFTRLARYHYPWVLLKPWDQYNSLERIHLVHSPLLILHGAIDSIVPYTDALMLHDKAQEPKKMYTFEGLGHNDLLSDPNFSTHIIDFIQNYCKPKGEATS